MIQAQLIRRGLLLEYLTLGWNVVGVFIVLGAAYTARSVALAGFGLDSLIEIFASIIVVWQLLGVNQHRERFALRLIGVAFFALALYILAQITVMLLTQAHPSPSIGGIVWLSATFIAMLLLAYGKRVTGKQLGSVVLMTEGHVTLIDADLASLVIVYYGIREGIHAWGEEEQRA
jgi:divalent metal cation (Fe/Co/Zn/Cd) transporter